MPSASIHREEIVIDDSSDDEFESSNSDCDVTGTDPASKSVHGAESSSADLSPGFRTAAAKAGWDDEALLMAALDGDCSEAAHSTPDKFRNSGGDACRERKREVRTPGQAITPASANRVHRKPRRPTTIDCSSDASLARLTLDEGSTSSTDHEPRRGSVVATDELRNESSLLAENAGSTSSSQPNKLQKEIEEAGNSSVLCTKDDESDDPCKENMKPPCLEQLRDELSCAVCLEICLEPSTTSCGHSFCRSCLQSVVRKCGLRCPKCRQALKGEGAINVVLWNTIQILFPDEIAKRIKNKKDDSNAVVTKPQPTSFVNASAMSSDSNSWRNGGPAVVNRHRPIGNFRRFTPPFRASRRQVTDLDDGETGAQNNTNVRSLSTRQQEEIDAVLAARLQESELMQASSHGIETFHRRLRESQRQSTDNVMAAVANLRSLASRTARYRTTRSQF